MVTPDISGKDDLTVFRFLKERYVRELIDYIHHNPVRAKMAAKATDYTWSSARFYSKLENKEIDEVMLVDRYGHFYPN